MLKYFNLKAFHELWRKICSSMDKICGNSNMANSMDINEVNALIRYASENGIDSPGPDPQKKDETTLVLLSRAVASYENHSTPVGQAELIRLYSRLVRKTKIKGHQVNGRTLLETRKSWIEISSIVLLTFILLVVAINYLIVEEELKIDQTPTAQNRSEVLSSPPSDQITSAQLVSLQNSYIPYIPYIPQITPFIWGALGACMYLTMRLYNFAQYRCFDRAQLHGIYLRVILGAVLAAVVLYIFDSEAFNDGKFQLDAKAIAFLVGLGVKLFYGALEKLIKVLVEKFNLSSDQVPGETDQVRLFLAQKLSEPSTAKNLQRKEILVELLEEYEQDRPTDAGT